MWWLIGCAELAGPNLDPNNCGVGTCVAGAYQEGGACNAPVAYPPDALISLLMCGGAVDACCGLGYCLGPAYIDDCSAYAPDAPISEVVCGGGYTGGEGVGTCIEGSWCDDAACYEPASAVSELFCGCQASPELSEGCGPVDCATFCDGCVCYVPSDPAVQAACPAGTGALRVYYDGLNYEHFVGAQALGPSGWIASGFAGGAGVIVRLDAHGEVLWSRTDASQVWNDVAPVAAGFVAGGLDAIVNVDEGTGATLWRLDLPSTGTIVEAVSGTANGEVIALGTAAGDLYLTRIGANGTPLWATVLGGPGAETAYDLVELPSGDLLLFGTTDSWGAGGRDLWFVRTTSAGTVLWARAIGGPAAEGQAPLRSRMTLTAAGDVAWATTSTSFTWGLQDAWYGLLDPDAVTLLWAWHFGWTGTEFASDLVERPDGSFWLLGEEFTDYLGFFVAEVDVNGVATVGWSWGVDPYLNYTAGGIGWDGGPFMISETHQYPVQSPNHRFLLLKGNPDGRLDGCCDVEPLLSAYASATFPTVTPTTPLVSAAVGATLASDAPAYPVLTRQVVCEVDNTYVCGGPVTSECLCTP
jgi:hypothetical protein